jgi:hypothetical protein
MKKNKQSMVTLAVMLFVAQCAFAQVPNIAAAGGPISNETCSAWVKNYEASGGKTLGHMYGSKILRKMLSEPSTAGIIIFVGLDSDGAEHLIFRTLNEEGNISNSDRPPVNNGLTCPPVCSKNGISEIGGEIEEVLAQQMIDKFQSTYPDRLLASSFSRAAVESVLNKKDAAGIYFANGLDENNAEHLILVGLQENGTIMWTGGGVNNSFPCPPYCPNGKYPQVKSASVKK